MVPGAMCEIRWYTNTNKFQYYIQDDARVTAFVPDPEVRTFDYRPGMSAAFWWVDFTMRRIWGKKL